MYCKLGFFSGKSDNSGEGALVWIAHHPGASNLFISASLKELKSSTTFLKRIGVATVLNYEHASAELKVLSHRRIWWQAGASLTNPMGNKSQALQILGCNRIKVIDSSSNQKPDNHDEHLVWQLPKQCHVDDTQLQMEVRAFDQRLVTIRIQWYGCTVEDRGWRPMKFFSVGMEGAG